MDISGEIQNPENEAKYDVWFVTNTKPTTQAINYAKCVNMELLTVEVPYGHSIMDRVVDRGVFPISSLPILYPYLERLYVENIILVGDILTVPTQTAETWSIPTTLWQQAQAETHKLLAACSAYTESQPPG